MKAPKATKALLAPLLALLAPLLALQAALPAALPAALQAAPFAAQAKQAAAPLAALPAAPLAAQAKQAAAWPCQASCAGAAGPGPRQEPALLKAEIAAEPGKSGGIYYAYPEPKGSELILPQPPEGYEPVYISHYGRHGSRWAINEKQYAIVIDFLRRQLEADNLTPLGIETLAKVEAIARHAQGHAGELAPLGQRQHKAIAARMFTRTPSLFTDSARISAVSSIEPRCIVSMAAFCESLKEKNPALRITRTASPGDMSFISYSTPAARAFTSDTASWRASHRAFRDSLLSPARLLSLLLKKHPSPREITASSASPSPASKATPSCSSPGSKAALSSPSPSGKAASSGAALKSEAAGRCPAPCAGPAGPGFPLPAAAGPGPSPSFLLKTLHDIAVTTQNTGLDIDLLSLFTPDELFALWQAINYNMYVSHANYGAAEGMLSARSLLSEIITHADEDLAGPCPAPRAGAESPGSQAPSPCSPQIRLRFGHDTALIRLLALMGIEGCANREADPRAFCTAWQDFRISPMAANLQLIFYQKAGPGSGEPLVLILLNERPASLPIPQAAPGFYTWSSLRSLWLPLVNP